MAVTAPELMLRLWPEASSPARARDAVRGFCTSRLLSGQVDDAVLMTSELVTNACQYSTGLITLLALYRKGRLLVSVSDDCPDLFDADPPLVADFAESGRGVLVLNQLAGAWGQRPTSDGKAVWFRLP